MIRNIGVPVTMEVIFMSVTITTFLEPLPTGDHELHFVGTTVDNPTTGTTRLAIDAKYHLTTEP